MSSVFSKTSFSYHFNLYIRQPWLSKKERELDFLLGMCRNKEERDLLIRLLHDFLYIDEEKRDQLLGSIVNHISNVWKLSPENTIIAAATFDKASDSAQAMLWPLVVKLEEIGWAPVQNFNNINGIYGNLKTNPNVIIFDDFSGTGLTLGKRVRDCWTTIEGLPERKKPADPIVVRVLSLVANIHARSAVERAGAEMFASYFYKKQISDIYRGRLLRRMRRRMLRLESLLDQTAEQNKFPSFGFGGAEATYCLSGGRAPNSVFPIFWWRHMPGGKARPTIVSRFKT